MDERHSSFVHLKNSDIYESQSRSSDRDVQNEKVMEMTIVEASMSLLSPLLVTAKIAPSLEERSVAIHTDMKIEGCDQASSTEIIQIDPLVQQKVTTPSNMPITKQDTRLHLALSPFVSWNRTTPLLHAMNQLLLDHLDSPVQKLLRFNQGNFAHQCRPIKPLMSTALTVIPMSMPMIPNVFLQFVQVILAYHQEKRNDQVISSKIATIGSKRKYTSDDSQMIKCKVPPSVLQSVYSNVHLDGVIDEYHKSVPVDSELVYFATPHGTNQQFSCHHYHAQGTFQAIGCHHTGQSGDVISRRPSRPSNAIKQIENDHNKIDVDTNVTLLTLQECTRALVESDDGRRARKKARKEKKRQIEQKRISENLNAGCVETDDQHKSRKKAEKERKRQSREERKRERKNGRQSRLPLLESPNAHFQVPLFCDEGCLEETSKVTPEHSNRSNIFSYPTENQRKRQALADKWFDPRIKKYRPKPIDSESPVSKDEVYDDGQAAKLTHHSRSGRELNPPVHAVTIQQSPQTQKSKHPLSTVLDSRLTDMSSAAKIPYNLSCPNSPPILRSPPPPTHSLAPQVVYPFNTTAVMTSLTAEPPLKFLCSEAFLGLWSISNSELSSGSWLSSLFPKGDGQEKLKSVSPIGRKFILHDTPLLDDIGVDIETPGRGAVVVCALSSWRILDVRTIVRKYILTAAVGKYKNLDFFLCVDVEMTPSLAADIASLQISMLCGGGNCFASFHTVTPKTLSAALAHRLLKSGAHPLTFMNESMIDDRVEQRVRFLLALVPCLTATGALSLLHAAGQGDNNPLSEEGSKLGIQKLLGSKSFLVNCRDEIKAGRSTTYLADMKTINQIAIASLVPLGGSAR